MSPIVATAAGCSYRRRGETTATAEPILVIGATGRHGSTGGHVARRVREEGKQVRVPTRTLNSRVDALADFGVEVAIGDLDDRRTSSRPWPTSGWSISAIPSTRGLSAPRRTMQPPCVSRNVQFGPW